MERTILSRKQLGELIRSARKENRYTLQDIASKVISRDGTPISAHTLAKIETGNQEPYWYYMIQIVDALDIELDEFV